MKKLCFRFEVIWCRSDVGGKTPPINFPQALPSSAPLLSNSVSGLKLFGAGVTLEGRLQRMVFLGHYKVVHFWLPV